MDVAQQNPVVNVIIKLK